VVSTRAPLVVINESLIIVVFRRRPVTILP
jgi:hypothetical protein